MNGGPYRNEYLKKRRKGGFLILFFSLIITGATILIVSGGKNKNATAQKTSNPAPPIMAKSSSENKKDSEKPSESEKSQVTVIPAEEFLDEDAQAVIANIQQQIERGKKKNQPQAQNKNTSSIAIVEQSPAEPKGKEKEKVRVFLDLFNKCRYSLLAKYEMQGGADLFVMNSYTGEVRFKTNYTGDGPLTLFQSDEKHGQRRFFMLFARGLTSNAEVFVLDSDTGDIQMKTISGNSNSLRFFTQTREGENQRYSAHINYDNLKFDFIVTDIYTGKSKILRDVEKPSLISLFQGTREPGEATLRYSSWAEPNSGDTDLYSLDWATGLLRIRRKQSQQKELDPFPDKKSAGPNRYFGWVNYNSGKVEFYAMDMYSGEFKIVPLPENKNEFQLFDYPMDPQAWQRYDTWAEYWLNGYWIYTFDTATGLFKSDMVTSMQKPYFPFPDQEFFPSESRRYEVSLIGRIQGGVIVYAIDTYTGEVRVFKDITEKKTIRLF